MNKKNLVTAIAEETGLTQKQVNRVLIVMLKKVKNALANNEKIQLVSFGSFEVCQRAARKGRNPQTGQEINIPPTKAPVFKPSPSLKEAVKR